jgi:hypothetical protein
MIIRFPHKDWTEGSNFDGCWRVERELALSNPSDDKIGRSYVEVGRYGERFFKEFSQGIDGRTYAEIELSLFSFDGMDLA